MRSICSLPAASPAFLLHSLWCLQSFFYTCCYSSLLALLCSSFSPSLICTPRGITSVAYGSALAAAASLCSTGADCFVTRGSYWARKSLTDKICFFFLKGIKNDSLFFMQLNLRHFRRGRRRSGAVVAHTGYSPHQQDPHEVHRNILPHANALCHFHIAASINPATGRNCTKCLLQGNYNFLLACSVSICVTCSASYSISLMIQNV